MLVLMSWIVQSSTGLGLELAKLSQQLESPMPELPGSTPGYGAITAATMSPSIAGSPAPSGAGSGGALGALSSLNLGDLENTEGLTAYEQILRLREVLASMRESARMVRALQCAG
eukprot:COSAG05_NODE_7849_length_763_cov_1.304217_2_plen_115_part_00